MEDKEKLKQMSNWDLLDLYTKEAKWSILITHGSNMNKPSKYSSSVLWDEIVNRMSRLSEAETYLGGK